MTTFYTDEVKTYNQYQETKEEFMRFAYRLNGEHLRNDRKYTEFLKTDLDKNLAEFGCFVSPCDKDVQNELVMFLNGK